MIKGLDLCCFGIMSTGKLGTPEKDMDVISICSYAS